MQEEFRHNPDVLVLIATDAAGEGVNLQNANLMVNYDLPWNPNRLEQRFGRIHRIGQTEVCHLWNLVANETREGEVFTKLLEKLEVERAALGGRVFDILGEAFENKSLKDLLIEAIRYGELPETKAKLDQAIDGALDTEHLREIMRRNALVEQHMGMDELYAIKEEMDKAQARKLQPYFIRAFFSEAFRYLGGEMKQREEGRYEIRHVPADLRERDRLIGETRTPVLRKYERICFEKHLIRQDGKPMLLGMKFCTLMAKSRSLRNSAVRRTNSRLIARLGLRVAVRSSMRTSVSSRALNCSQRRVITDISRSLRLSGEPPLLARMKMSSTRS